MIPILHCIHPVVPWYGRWNSRVVKKGYFLIPVCDIFCLVACMYYYTDSKSDIHSNKEAVEWMLAQSFIQFLPRFVHLLEKEKEYMHAWYGIGHFAFQLPILFRLHCDNLYIRCAKVILKYITHEWQSMLITNFLYLLCILSRANMVAWSRPLQKENSTQHVVVLPATIERLTTDDWRLAGRAGSQSLFLPNQQTFLFFALPELDEAKGDLSGTGSEKKIYFICKKYPN